MMTQSRLPTKDRRKIRVPVCWLMTDARLGGAMPTIAARHLPPRSAIIVRPHALSRSGLAELIIKLRRIAITRRHLLLWGGVGRPLGFTGQHIRRGVGVRRGGGFISMPVHSHHEADNAQRLGADVVLISPAFSTRSHPDTAPLGARRFAALARKARRPAIALGGMNMRRHRIMRRFGAEGWAAIDGWIEVENADSANRSQKRNWVPT
jgi:thiamine-phosphate pyrophosphorylase